jgi:hypothetical protein
MNVDAEWEVPGREWRQPAMAMPDLRARVKKESRRMRLFLAADILVTIVIGGGMLGWAILSRQADVLVLAVATWTFIVAAWIFGSVNRAGNWSPVAADTSAFLDLSIRRCRAAANMAIFGIALWLVEVVFVSSWVFRYLAQRSTITVGEFLLRWPMMIWEVATIVFVALSLWYRRRQQAEERSLLELRRQLQEMEPPEREASLRTETDRAEDP